MELRQVVFLVGEAGEFGALEAAAANSPAATMERFYRAN
jgi:hypothetical protein